MATNVVNCLFQGLMPNWAVDCDATIQDLLPQTALPSSPDSLVDPSSMSPEIALSELNGENRASECVKNKFGPWQFSVLTAFQGYLARMPLQQHQMLLSQHLRHSLSGMQGSASETHMILLDTIRLQRDTIETLFQTSDRIAGLIDQHVAPLLNILPNPDAVEEIVLTLETQIDHARTWWKNFLNALIPSFALFLSLVNLIFGVSMILSAVPNALVCVAYTLDLVPPICAIKTIWTIFLVLRLLHCLFPPKCTEEEILVENIYRLLQKRRRSSL